MGSTRTTLEWFFTLYKRCSYQACSNYEMEWKQSHCQTCRKKLSDRCEFNSESYALIEKRLERLEGLEKWFVKISHIPTKTMGRLICCNSLNVPITGFFRMTCYPGNIRSWDILQIKSDYDLFMSHSPSEIMYRASIRQYNLIFSLILPDILSNNSDTDAQ